MVVYYKALLESYNTLKNEDRDFDLSTEEYKKAMKILEYYFKKYGEDLPKKSSEVTDNFDLGEFKIKISSTCK